LQWILAPTLAVKVLLSSTLLTRVTQLMSKVFMATWVSLKASQLELATLQSTTQSCRRPSLGYPTNAYILKVRWKNPSSIQIIFEQMDLLLTHTPSSNQMESHFMVFTMRNMTCTFHFACMGAPVTSLHDYQLKRRSMIVNRLFLLPNRNNGTCILRPLQQLKRLTRIR